VTFTYGAVDGSDDPSAAADWQDRIDAWPMIRAYKMQMARVLPEDGLVLDVGCGTGGDLAAIGVNRAFGLDTSKTMCGRAAARGAAVCRGEAGALPFSDGSFAACRADRVLQHLGDPVAAIGELLRVTRSGGSIVLADPDQESLTIHVDGVPRSFIDRVKALRRDAGYRNGRLASRLPALLAGLGLVDVRVEAFPLLLTDPADAFGIPTWPRHWRDRGVADFEEGEIERWEQALAAGRGFVFALLYLVVAGRLV
jgi:SAM-dependent methyltransferase